MRITSTFTTPGTFRLRGGLWYGKRTHFTHTQPAPQQKKEKTRRIFYTSCNIQVESIAKKTTEVQSCCLLNKMPVRCDLLFYNWNICTQVLNSEYYSQLPRRKTTKHESKGRQTKGMSKSALTLVWDSCWFLFHLFCSFLRLYPARRCFVLLPHLPQPHSCHTCDAGGDLPVWQQWKRLRWPHCTTPTTQTSTVEAARKKQKDQVSKSRVSLHFCCIFYREAGHNTGSIVFWRKGKHSLKTWHGASGLAKPTTPPPQFSCVTHWLAASFQFHEQFCGDSGIQSSLNSVFLAFASPNFSTASSVQHAMQLLTTFTLDLHKCR